jgi:hypothetical protein
MGRFYDDAKSPAPLRKRDKFIEFNKLQKYRVDGWMAGYDL